MVENERARHFFALPEIIKKAKSLQVSADDTTVRIAPLEGKVDRTTQRFDSQAHTNINNFNYLDLIEASGEANPCTPVANGDPKLSTTWHPLLPQHLILLQPFVTHSVKPDIYRRIIKTPLIMVLYMHRLFKLT